MICQPKSDILLWWEESKRGVCERNVNGVFKKRKGKKILDTCLWWETDGWRWSWQDTLKRGVRQRQRLSHDQRNRASLLNAPGICEVLISFYNVCYCMILSPFWCRVAATFASTWKYKNEKELLCCRRQIIKAAEKNLIEGEKIQMWFFISECGILSSRMFYFYILIKCWSNDQLRESLKRQSDAPEDVVWIRSSVRLRTSLGMLETRNTSTAVRNRSQEI